MSAKERYAARDRAHLGDIIASVRSELINPSPRPGHAFHDLLPLPPVGSGFPPGARVYVDGEQIATVREFYPNGSTSYGFPHYLLDVAEGDRNVAIGVARIGVTLRVG